MGEPVMRSPLFVPVLLLGLLGSGPIWAAPPESSPASGPSSGPSSGLAPSFGAVSCAVRVIHAAPSGSEFDVRLNPLRPQLTQPPLSAWKNFRLLQQHDLAITPKTPATFALPGGHEGSLSYLGRADGPKRKRVRLRLNIKDGSALLLSTVFVIDEGGTVMSAGMKHEGGMLILGITCNLPETH